MARETRCKQAQSKKPSDCLLTHGEHPKGDMSVVCCSRDCNCWEALLFVFAFAAVGMASLNFTFRCLPFTVAFPFATVLPLPMPVRCALVALLGLGPPFLRRNLNLRLSPRDLRPRRSADDFFCTRTCTLAVSFVAAKLLHAVAGRLGYAPKTHIRLRPTVTQDLPSNGQLTVSSASAALVSPPATQARCDDDQPQKFHGIQANVSK